MSKAQEGMDIGPMDSSAIDIVQEGGLGRFRPWIGEDGKHYATIRGKDVEWEVPALLTKAQWEQFDKNIVDRFAINAPITTKLFSYEGLGLTINNGIARTVLEYQTPIPSKAELSGRETVDPREGPEYKIHAVPLPITHADSFFSKNPLSITAAALAVADCIEFQLFNKLRASPKMGNIPSVTKHMNDLKHYGPYIILKNKKTVRTKPLLDYYVEIWDSNSVELDELFIIQATPNVLRIINGQPPIMIQMFRNFKVLTIMVPDIRDQSGILRI